jgi:hypothetical protein
MTVPIAKLKKMKKDGTGSYLVSYFVAEYQLMKAFEINKAFLS